MAILDAEYGGHATSADLAVGSETHEAEDLDQYRRCPRSYLYQRILQLSGARSDNSYVQFHRCVYAVLRWIDGCLMEPQSSMPMRWLSSLTSGRQSAVRSSVRTPVPKGGDLDRGTRCCPAREYQQTARGDLGDTPVSCRHYPRKA